MRIFFMNMVSISFLSSVFIVLFLLMCWLGNKKYVYLLNYYVGLLIALRLLFCFPLNMSFVSNNYMLKNSYMEENDKDILEEDIGQDNDVLIVHKEKQHSTSMKIQTNVMNLLIRIWLIGVTIFIVIRAINYMLFWRSIMKNGVPVEKEIYEIYMSVESELDYHYYVRLVKVKDILSPFALGFTKKVIVIPDIDYKMSEIDVSYVFRHELIHLKNHDNWYKLLLTISQSIHWFNPIVGWYFKIVERNIEYLCDTQVVYNKNIVFRKEYCKNVLQMMENIKTNKAIKIRTSYFSGVERDKKNLKERMENILNSRKRKVKKYAICLIFLLLLCITSLFIFKSERNNLFKWGGIGSNYYESTDLSCYGEFKESGGYSNFKIFPEIISTDMNVTRYLYQYKDSIFDPTVQVYMECTYEKDSYLKEIERLQDISEEYNGEVKNVHYDINSFDYPAYVTIDANNHCYEYALILENKRIVYVFLQFVNKEDIGFPLDYLPKEYENKQDSGYTIYVFYREDGTGICTY